MGPGSLFHDRKRRRIRTVTAASFPYFRLEWRLAAKASNTWKGVLLAEIRREMERLRPVYETGVLRLLLRNNSMLYVALLRSTFDPLTGSCRAKSSKNGSHAVSTGSSKPAITR